MRLNIKNDVLYEAILLSMCGDDIYAAPVGFRKNGDFVEIRVYKGSRLSQVVLTCDIVSLNIVNDPVYFVKTAFKKDFAYQDELLKEVIVRGKTLFLSNSVGYIVLEKSDVVHYNEYFIVKYKINDVYVNQDTVLEPYTRCYSNIVELAIYLSKLKALKDPEIWREYLNRGEVALEIINKTCNEEYRALAKRLWVLTSKWLEE